MMGKIIAGLCFYIESLGKPMCLVGVVFGGLIWLVMSIFQQEFSFIKLGLILTITSIGMSIGYARYLFDKGIYDEVMEYVLNERVYGKVLSKMIKDN